MTNPDSKWELETNRMKVSFSSYSDRDYFRIEITSLNKETGLKRIFGIRESAEEYAAKGGTAVFCPSCNQVRICEAIDPSGLGKTGDRRRQMLEHRDVQWFRRGRSCRTCFYTFITAEVHEELLFELIRLRNEMIKGKDISLDQHIQYGGNIIPFPKN